MAASFCLSDFAKYGADTEDGIVGGMLIANTLLSVVKALEKPKK